MPNLYCHTSFHPSLVRKSFSRDISIHSERRTLHEITHKSIFASRPVTVRCARWRASTSIHMRTFILIRLVASLLCFFIYRWELSGSTSTSCLPICFEIFSRSFWCSCLSSWQSSRPLMGAWALGVIHSGATEANCIYLGRLRDSSISIS